MPGGSKKGGGLEVKSAYKAAVGESPSNGSKTPSKSLSDEDPFKMRSGNSPLFKYIGSSPLHIEPTQGGVDAMGRQGGVGSEFVKGSVKQEATPDASGQTNSWTNRAALDEHIGLPASKGHAAEAASTEQATGEEGGGSWWGNFPNLLPSPSGLGGLGGGGIMGVVPE